MWWCELMWRNPSRLFSNRHLAISNCRWCLFKELCLENEKNPVIRHLVLGEEIRDDITDVFDWTDTVAEIQSLLETDGDRVHFKLHQHTDIVDVYFNDSLLYKINRNLYYKLTLDDEEHTEALRDCAE